MRVAASRRRTTLRVFDVDEDGAGAIGHGELRPARQRDRSDDGVGGGIDHGGIVAAAVEGEYAAPRGLKQHGIGVLSGLDGRENLVARPIKDENRAGAAVEIYPTFPLVVEGDAVRVGETSNLVDQFAGPRIDQHNPV